jgi:hypothetical protein
MKTILHRLTRLFHPITVAVILIGITGFLLGLIVAVERQDPANEAPRVDIEASNRVAQLESALADRKSELANLQAQLTRQRAEAPSPTEIVDAKNRIASLEAALANSTAELNALQSELDELSGQLAGTIQSRDELRVQIDRIRLDNENERASLQQTIADLSGQLEIAQDRARALAQAAAEQQQKPPAGAPAETTQAAAAAEADTAEPTAVTTSAPVEAAEPQLEETEPAAPAEPSTTDQQTAAPVPTAGPITQGIAAYRATDYRKAYELWLPVALKGSARAQFYVGALYFEGRGVPADRVMSYMWLRAATKANDPGAIKLLDQLRDGMTGPELAEAETRIANGETIPLQ